MSSHDNDDFVWTRTSGEITKGKRIVAEEEEVLHSLGQRVVVSEDEDKEEGEERKKES